MSAFPTQPPRGEAPRHGHRHPMRCGISGTNCVAAARLDGLPIAQVLGLRFGRVHEPTDRGFGAPAQRAMRHGGRV